MAAQERQQLMQQACDVIKAVSQPDKQRPDSTAAALSKAVLEVHAERIKLDVSKIALACASEPAPTTADLVSLLQGLVDKVKAAFSLCNSLVTEHTGSTLQHSVRTTLQQAADSLCAFLKGIVLEGKEPARMAGQTWEKCDALPKLPLSNKMALGRALTRIAAEVKAVLKEMKELVNDSLEEKQVEAVTEPASTEDAAADMYAFEGEPLTAKELAVAQAAVDFVAEVLHLIKHLGRQLLNIEDLTLDQDAVQVWESVNFHLKALAVAVNDLGASLYGPQDKNDIEGIEQALENTLAMIKLDVYEELDLESLPQGQAIVEAFCSAFKRHNRLHEQVIEL